MKIKALTFLTILLFQPYTLTAKGLTDQTGAQVLLKKIPTRVISLAPSITEIVYFLDKGSLLKAATQFSNVPEEASRLPRVGSYVRLDLEKIISMEPDLCIAIKDGNPKHTVEKIIGLGIPVYVIDPRSVKGIMEAIEGIGEALGAEDKANLLIDDMQKRLQSIQEKISSSKARPQVFFQIDASPLISAGEDTFIHELIILAGGTNSTAGAKGYPRYSWEDILSMQPEVTFIATMAGGQSNAELLSKWQRWPMIPAVANKRVHVVDSNLFDRPTPRLIEGLETFARLIHPELFKKHSD